MHREGASNGAVPGLGAFAVGHEAGPVGLNEPTNVLIPSEEATPSSLPDHQVIQYQMGHMHPRKQNSTFFEGVIALVHADSLFSSNNEQCVVTCDLLKHLQIGIKDLISKERLIAGSIPAEMISVQREKMLVMS